MSLEALIDHRLSVLEESDRDRKIGEADISKRLQAVEMGVAQLHSAFRFWSKILVAVIAAAATAVVAGGCRPPATVAEEVRPDEFRVACGGLRMVPEFVAAIAGAEAPFDAITVGGKTFYFSSAFSPCLQAHEAVHRDQQRREGAAFYRKYMDEHRRHGYAGNRYEREANAAQAACLEHNGDGGARS